ncbi:TonB-linked SusC/RagA family outer membrane protein [Mucilaginibacter yixingensis]|uniref:TonB-linked SusC/RagA family outer membrane protein n=1 Tax=Mucilaginibacter yixingensis TaxID=1295612 RepID=A0A2T5J5W5_9SPHI|nr:SusC/RagA family TonB-linked outer membrane protein [Mucilaginibacter yixingensis]PTQ93661.1 TonB-linked SusC/RagA family outer membrane protein [Mucilaginibacter yixingensis]
MTKAVHPKPFTVIITLLLAMLTLHGFSQSTVSGQITDGKTHETVIGATIRVKGTSTAVASDGSGNFKIAATQGAILQISFLGYNNQEVTANTKSFMHIALTPVANDLNEVIVVGYGTKKKETLTGAISQVGAEVFKDRPVPNAALALQGEIPGLVITRNSPRPGNEGLAIRLRGESSTSAVSPLIIIDGVPTVADFELSTLNPNDIESVTALKDASAAIYGARAQGGVILITTKRGKGKAQVTYNPSFSLNTIAKSVPWGNMSEWAQLYLQTSTQDRVDASGNPIQYLPQWTLANLQRMANGESFDYTQPSGLVSHYGDNNWQNALYGNSFSEIHNLSLRGATDKTAYAASLGYSNNKSILKTAYDGEIKYNARFNYDYDLSKNVKWSSGISYDTRTVQSPKNGVGAGFFDAPIFPVYNVNGNYYDDYGYRNPVAMTQAGGRIRNTDNFFRFNTKLSVKVFDGLTLSGTAAITKRDGMNNSYNQTYNLYSWTGDRVTSTQYNPAAVSEVIANTIYDNFGVFADYNKSIQGKHNFALTLGSTAEKQEDRTLSAGRTGLLYPGLFDLNTATPVNATNGSSDVKVGLTSYIGRFDYDYNKRYLIEAIGRSDASSRFDPDHRRQNFYGISAGWVISEEQFMKPLKFLNYLKVRGDYGETGGLGGGTNGLSSTNGAIGAFNYVSSIGSGTALFGSSAATQGTNFISNINNLQLTWERMLNKDIGLDFTLLNNKLSGSFDIYERKNTGLILSLIYPGVLGANAPPSNAGDLRVRGFDANINWRDKIGEVSYNIGINFSNNKNLLIKRAGATAIAQGQNAPLQGYPLNSLFVYQTAGYFPTQAAADAYYTKYTATTVGNLGSMTGNSKLRAGDLNVVDRNGDGVINMSDLYFAGDADPHYTFGTNLGAQWKGFDLSAFFQGVLNQNLLRGGNARAPFFRNYLDINTYYVGKTWTPDNTGAAYPRLSFDNNRNNWNWQFNDVNIQNLRYVRLKSLILGYTLPKTLISRVGLSRVRAYLSGNDLLTFSSIKDGFDPERGSSSDSSYPFIKTYTFGLEVEF